MSQLSVILQESVRREREARTILGLLRLERMEGTVDSVGNSSDNSRRRRSLKERLGWNGIGCCGATWAFRPTTISVSHDGDEEREQEEEQISSWVQGPTNPECLSPIPASSGMNLAAALAAERQFRSMGEEDGNDDGDGNGGSVPRSPFRVSLMRLLEETEGGDDDGTGTERAVQDGGEWGNDSVCCVCMGRKKGAAFIPCGHTFCRVCSREVWTNRGSCPLCNRSILEILDIF